VETFTLKRNDTAPSLEATLSDDNGAIDLTGASVMFVMKTAPTRACNTPSVSAFSLKKAGVVADDAGGVVRYDWEAVDTLTEGNYRGEFEVTFVDGKVWTFPSSGYIPISIQEDLG